MANIFAILTAVVLAITAFLAYQNMGKTEDPGRGYKGWISKRQNEQHSLTRKNEELKQTEGELATTESGLDQVDTDNTKLDGEVKEQLKKNEELAAERDQKRAEAEAKGKEVQAKNDEIKQFGNVDDVVADLKQTRTQLAQIEADIDQREAQQASLKSRLASTGRSIDALREQIDWRVNGKSNPNLATRVRSAYPSLGFVTLAGGDNLGIVKNSPLEVLRGGEVIGKLIVTTVEATTSAADVVPGSVAQGRRVLAGDRVRVPKKDEVPAAGPPTPAG